MAWYLAVMRGEDPVGAVAALVAGSRDVAHDRIYKVRKLGLVPRRWLRPCQTCGTEFESGNVEAAYCSVRCRKAVGNAKRRGHEVHVPVKVFTCQGCGGLRRPGVDAPLKARSFCSLACKRSALMGSWTPSAVRWLLRRAVERAGRGGAKLLRSLYQMTDAPFIAGNCSSCGRPFLTRRSTTRFCSRKCNRRARARRVGSRSVRGSVGLRDVGDRDGWLCGLCGEPVDATLKVPNRWAPTVDHIVPLVLGGTHDWDNVQLAHMTCNSSKGARVEAAR